MTELAVKTTEEMLEVSRNLLEISRNHSEQISVIVKEVANIRNDTEILRSEIYEMRNQLPITGTQRKMIRKEVSKKVRSILRNQGNRSRTQIAYSKAYRSLEPYGYCGMDATPRENFEQIMQALPKVINFTIEEIITRENKINKKKEMIS